MDEDFFKTLFDVIKRREEVLKKKKEYKIYLSSLRVPNVSYPYASNFQYKVDKKYSKKKKTKKRVLLNNVGIELPSVEKRKISEQDRLKFFVEIYGKNSGVDSMKYPVTKMKILGVEYVFAYANIVWNPNNNELVYNVIEPPISEEEKNIISMLIGELIKRLEIPVEYIKLDFEKIKENIVQNILSIIKYKKINIPQDRLPIILYYVIRDSIGYGKIDPLMRDPLIEDISCNGYGIPVFIFHRNPIIGEIKTNIIFSSEEELDDFVMKLSIRSGRVVSAANPLLDGTLPDGSRLQITYGKDISRKGSSFTIRKFTEDPFTITDLLAYGTVDEYLAAYLWLLVEEGRSFLVSGGTATGKTSFLNAISMFIKPEKKIVSIEDTAELRLPHPNWLQEVARPGYGPNRYGEVTMFDLLKAALRQRPDYIIVGEVRGEEAYILFQAMATGHAGLGTIHAESMEALIDRLLSPPISLPPSLLEVLDAVVFLKRMKYQGKYVRRVDKIYEIVGFNRKKNDVERIESFVWEPSNDSFKPKSSVILNKIMKLRNWSKEDLELNLKLKMKVIDYLFENKIRDYRKIGEIVKLYYYDIDKLVRIVGF